MNGLAAHLDALKTLGGMITPDPATDVLICPPASLLHRACDVTRGSAIAIGAQDCHAEATGAFTGDISAAMVADTGATHVIVGHSERRDAHRETDADIRAKASAANGAGLTAIICIGESEAQRVSGETLDILAAQLAGSCPDAATAATTVIAYEPIWAIGTGLTPTIEQIDEVHDFIRQSLIARFGPEIGDGIPLLYGGSVKPGNAAEIFATDNVDGALVGGASLKQSDFSPIINALEESA